MFYVYMPQTCYLADPVFNIGLHNYSWPELNERFFSVIQCSSKFGFRPLFPHHGFTHWLVLAQLYAPSFLAHHFPTNNTQMR